eukprot:999292-Prymnesium_polylepis.2
MLGQLQKAIAGTYMPRPDVDEKALDDAELALILGGPRSLHALQRSQGFVSKSTILESRPRPRFVTSWDSTIQVTTIRTNMQRFILATPVLSSRAIHHLMLDDVALEKRHRPSPEDNKMRGYGRESDFSGLSLDVSSQSTLEALEAAEAAVGDAPPKLVFGEELTVFAVGPNRGTDYAIYLTAASTTAKKDAQARDLEPAIENHIKLWKSEGAWEARGPLTTIAKDSASIMNAAVFGYCTRFQIDRSSAVGTALFGDGLETMRLFFSYCGHSSSEPIVDVCDDKHWGKRFRMALKRAGGIKIKDYTFNRRLITRLLLESKYTTAEGRLATYGDIDTWFGEAEEDAQNVPALTKLLVAIASLRLNQVSDFSAERQETPTFAAELGELHVLSEIAACHNVS